MVMRPDRPSRQLSGSELRELLVLRARLRETAVGLPRAALHAALVAMEQAHAGRPPRPVALMTGGELLRELKWRLETASPAELRAGAASVERARRARARREARRAARA
ncbi:MAG: hypothetical protein QN147_09525 [Armatimonadota bacterium]|nr:hypothetical protein [Armatimonadota bacterium]